MTYLIIDCERSVIQQQLDNHAQAGFILDSIVFTGEHEDKINGHIFRMFTLVFRREEK